MSEYRHDMQLYENALERLKSFGYRLTTARQLVLQILCENDAHLTSADVLSLVEKSEESIGRASVFRTLDLLTELAIIRPTYLRANTPHYIVMPESGHHAHIICPQCGLVTEIEDCAVDDLLHTWGETHNVEITGHVLELYGICDQCR